MLLGFEVECLAAGYSACIDSSVPLFKLLEFYPSKLRNAHGFCMAKNKLLSLLGTALLETTKLKTLTMVSYKLQQLSNAFVSYLRPNNMSILMNMQKKNIWMNAAIEKVILKYLSIITDISLKTA